jgi:hypothetical protein
MKARLVKVRRRPPWPPWALALVLGWLATVGAAVWLMLKRHTHIELCLFKRITGYPCPTCGSTRGVLHILRGDVPAAWTFNPLLFTVLAVAAALLVVRVAFGRAVRIHLTRAEKRIAWIVGIALVLLNWAYVIVYVG